MAARGSLLRCEEAKQLIDQIDDPITKNFVNMAFARFVIETYTGNANHPSCDIDMLYVLKVLKEYFSEHDVIAQTLAGERVGAWFDDEE